MRRFRNRELCQHPARQRGAALFAILMIVGIGAAVLLAAGFLRATQRLSNDKQTEVALAQAKDALIGYAATYLDTHPNDPNNVLPPYNGFGFLPCPDLGSGFGGEGAAAGSCGSKDVSVVGRLPWKTLGLPPLRDGYGECLWYVVSGTFKYNPQTDLMNWDTDGLLDRIAADAATHLAGNPADPTKYAVAVVFAPGPMLPGQNRAAGGAVTPQCGGNYNASSYLDSSGITSNAVVNAVANALTPLIVALDSAMTGSGAFNDKAVAITPDEIFARRVVKRSDLLGYLNDPGMGTYGLLQKTAQCIAQYGKNNAPGDKRLPWAAPVGLSNFGTDSLYDDSANLLAGRVPYRVDNSKTATGNTMSGSSLLTTSVCPAGWNNVVPWYENWKDHLFYAVADAFKPPSGLAGAALPCNQPGAKCLTVDGVGPYAAVVIFANKKLGTQQRNTNIDYTSTDKSNVANYLEGKNASSITAASGNGDFTRTVSTTMNDGVVCINQDLTVDPTCVNPVTGAPPPVVSFQSNIGDFVAAGATNSVRVNPDGSVSVSLNQAQKASCFWFPNALTLSGTTLRVYFEFVFGTPQQPQDTSSDSSANGDGFTFTLLPGATDVTGVCGNENKTGYENVDTKKDTMVTPNVAVEVDTFYGSGDSKSYATNSDPANMANHVAILTGSLTHAGSNPSCGSVNGGCWFESPAANRNPNWLEDSVLHRQRLEFQTVSACGAGQVLVAAWIDCANCGDVSSNYTATPPTLAYCTPLPTVLQSIKLGFTAGSSAGHKQYLTISNFKAGNN